jgi:hypothetical protein
VEQVVVKTHAPKDPGEIEAFILEGPETTGLKVMRLLKSEMSFLNYCILEGSLSLICW